MVEEIPDGCWVCGASLEHRRAQARTCSARCRQRRRRGRREPRSQRLARRWGLRPTDFWRTPPWLVAAVAEELPLTVDVSSTALDAVCARHLSPAEDGLRTPWGPLAAGGWAWWNPPYSPGLLPWVEKAVAERAAGVSSVGLVPPATGARYMELAFDHAREVRFIRGRVPFLHPDTGEPGGGNRGDSCLLIFDAEHKGRARWSYVALQELEDRGRAALSGECDARTEWEAAG